MFEITIPVGEYLWSEDGKHIIDDNGFAIRAEEETVVALQDQETYDRVTAIIDFNKPEEPSDE